MLKQLHLEHQFVRHLPDVLRPGILYISVEYATASHLCCCGCGEEVVTPFTPAQWKMSFDGETVSLHPSVGNWLLACRSHYVIRHGRVLESEPWSDAQIATGLAHDNAARRMMFDESGAPPPKAAEPNPMPVGKRSIWAKLTAWTR